MRIRVLRDLHREFGGTELPDVPADVMVLAGDIDRGTKNVVWVRKPGPEASVLYVAVDHEFKE